MNVLTAVLVRERLIRFVNAQKRKLPVAALIDQIVRCPETQYGYTTGDDGETVELVPLKYNAMWRLLKRETLIPNSRDIDHLAEIQKFLIYKDVLTYTEIESVSEKAAARFGLNVSERAYPIVSRPVLKSGHYYSSRITDVDGHLSLLLIAIEGHPYTRAGHYIKAKEVRQSFETSATFHARIRRSNYKRVLEYIGSTVNPSDGIGQFWGTSVEGYSILEQFKFSSSAEFETISQTPEMLFNSLEEVDNLTKHSVRALLQRHISDDSTFGDLSLVATFTCYKKDNHRFSLPKRGVVRCLTF